MRFGRFTISDQSQALERLAKLISDGSVDPLVVTSARAIVSDCPARDDRCELGAIFEAVKYGTSKVPGLERGIRYVRDPRRGDFFIGAPRLLKLAASGAAAEDCDGHSILVAALAAALGFTVGARAFGREKGIYTHVYAVALLPKNYSKQIEIVGMDTTVPESDLGWQPKEGFYKTAWVGVTSGAEGRELGKRSAG